MPPTKKSKRNINNSLNNSILIRKTETSKSSKSSMKPMNLSETQKREDFMISMVLMGRKEEEDRKIC